jgi:hypothetical protein
VLRGGGLVFRRFFISALANQRVGQCIIDDLVGHDPPSIR